MPSFRICVLPFLAFFLAGCNQQDTAALTRIAKKVQHRSEIITGDLKASAAGHLNLFTESGAEGRVVARLRWDKELSGAVIEVVGTNDGIELRGKVQSNQQRRRAVMLAESTAGVTAVIDNLTQIEP